VYQRTTSGGWGRIYLYDLSTGTNTPLTTGSAGQGSYDPSIHGTRAVWQSFEDDPSDGDIFGHDLVGGATGVLAGGPGTQAYPDVFGDRVVYEDYGVPAADADIHMFDLTDGTETKITDRDAGTKWDDNQYDPRIWGDTVVWVDYRNPDDDVYAYHIADGTEQQITAGNADQDYPTVFRELITFDDARNNYNVYLHDMRDGMEYPLTSATGFQEDSSVWGNKVAWEDKRDNVQRDIWLAESELELDRSGGANRYETASLISESHFAGAGTVVVATGADFADALAASGLAGCYGGPLLLTLPDQLHSATSAEIDRLGATDAVIVGGEGAVAPAVANALSGMGLAVERIGGTDRYDTAAKIAAEIESMTGTNFEKTAFIARGDEFPDALAVSPLAYYNRFPILLTRPDAWPAASDTAFTGLDIETAIIAGGPGAVSAGVKNGVDALLSANGGGLSERWAGPTRYETAVEVAEQACDRYWAGRGFIGLAVGDNFPDALAGGAAAGREFGVLLLTYTDDLPTAAEEFAADSGDGIGWVEAFGGTAVVDDDAGDEVIQNAP
jgi:putative cell wall-binding protein